MEKAVAETEWLVKVRTCDLVTQVDWVNSERKRYLCDDFIKEYFDLPKGTKSIKLQLYTHSVEGSYRIYLQRMIGRISNDWYVWGWEESKCDEALFNNTDAIVTKQLGDRIPCDRTTKFYLRIECR